MAWAMSTPTIGYPTNVGKHTDWASAPALSLPAIVFWPGDGQNNLADGLTVDSPTPTTMSNADTLNRDSDGEDFACVTFNPWESGSWTPKKVRIFMDALIAAAGTYKIDVTKIFHCGLSLGSIALSQCIMQVLNVGNYREAKGYFITSGGANTFAIWPDSMRQGMNSWPNTLIKGVYGEDDISGNWVTVQMDTAADGANGVNQAIANIPLTAVDQITNGDFTTDLTGWTTKAGDSGTWAVVSNKASITTTTTGHNSDILIQAALTELTQYDVKFYYTESAADIIGYVVSLDSSDNIVNSVVIPGGNTTAASYTNTKKHIMLNSGAGGVKIGFYFLTGAAGATMTIDTVICRNPGKYRLWEIAGYVHVPSWEVFLGNTADDDDFNGFGMYNQICDVVPPTVPIGLISSAITQHSFTVTWTPSTDATTFVWKYEVYLDGALIDTLTAEIPYHPAVTYDFINLVPNTNYNVVIKAVDFLGNVSAGSNNFYVLTNPSPPYPAVNYAQIPPPPILVSPTTLGVNDGNVFDSDGLEVEIPAAYDVDICYLRGIDAGTVENPTMIVGQPGTRPTIGNDSSTNYILANIETTGVDSTNYEVHYLTLNNTLTGGAASGFQQHPAIVHVNHKLSDIVILNQPYAAIFCNLNSTTEGYGNLEYHWLRMFQDNAGGAYGGETFYLGKTTAPTADNHAIDKLRISHCWGEYWGREGLQITDGIDFDVSNCTFYNCGNSTLGGQNRGLQIHNSHGEVRNCIFDGSVGASIELFAEGVTFYRCYFRWDSDVQNGLWTLTNYAPYARTGGKIRFVECIFDPSVSQTTETFEIHVRDVDIDFIDCQEGTNCHADMWEDARGATPPNTVTETGTTAYTGGVPTYAYTGEANVGQYTFGELTNTTLLALGMGYKTMNN